MINFDFIILIMILFCVIKGIINGLYKQVKTFLTLLIPFIFSYFLRGIIFSKLSGLSFFTKFMNFLFKIFSNFIEVDSPNYFSRIIVYCLIYIIIYFIISSLFKLFSPSIMNLITKDKNKPSRIIGGVLGFLNAYLLLLIVYIIIGTFVDFNQTTFLSKMFFELNGKILINLMRF